VHHIDVPRRSAWVCLVAVVVGVSFGAMVVFAAFLSAPPQSSSPVPLWVRNGVASASFPPPSPQFNSFEWANFSYPGVVSNFSVRGSPFNSTLKLVLTGRYVGSNVAIIVFTAEVRGNLSTQIDPSNLSMIFNSTTTVVTGGVPYGLWVCAWGTNISQRCPVYSVYIPGPEPYAWSDWASIDLLNESLASSGSSDGIFHFDAFASFQIPVGTGAWGYSVSEFEFEALLAGLSEPVYCSLTLSVFHPGD